jgi:beta-glucanase (GH16 family)
MAVAASSALVTITMATAATRPVGTAVRDVAATRLSCGGEILRKPDGTLWQCSFDDEFGGTSLDAAKWAPLRTADSGFTSGPSTARACYVDAARNIAVARGALRLTARRLSSELSCASPTGAFRTRYTSGEVTSYYALQQTYGRFEIRAKLPTTTAKGLQETLWLWPVDDTKYGRWPLSGEIDLAEFYSRHPHLDIPYVHYIYDQSTVDPVRHVNVVTAYSCRIRYAAYNTYAVQWLPGRITILVDGRTCLIDSYRAAGLASPAPFDQPFFLALTQALGIGGNAFDPASTPLPATTSIDYVRVWR